MMPFRDFIMFRLLFIGLLLQTVQAFAPQHSSSPTVTRSTTRLHVFGGNTKNAAGLTILPKGISPFEKSKRDVQAELRKLAESAMLKGLGDGKKQLELEFPPLLGGEGAKSQFDDFDNVQELNKNRDWCVELLPSLAQKYNNIWFVLPDLKEVELCKDEWGGKRYRDAASFTSIEAVTEHYSGSGGGDGGGQEYSKPWGATFAGFANQLVGGGESGSGLLGDKRALDALKGECDLHLVCQPGVSNGRSWRAHV
jgi:hypothetical protein